MLVSCWRFICELLNPRAFDHTTARSGDSGSDRVRPGMAPAVARGLGGAQKMSKAASNVAMSSFLLTNAVRNALRKSASFLMSMNVSARVASVSLRGPASRPASWRSRAKAPSRGNRSGRSGTSRLLDQRRHLLTNSLQVLLVLQRRAQGRIHQRGVDACRAECGQRSRPIEGLGDARHLVELHAPQALHEGGHLACEPFRRLRRSGPHDLDLFLEVGIVDPVVEAAALQRVVHLARAVRRDDHKWRLLRLDGADLRNRDLEVGEQLEQERLELLIGTVDLIDQEHRRSGVVVIDGVQQRTPQQELRAEDLALGGPAVLALPQQPNMQKLARIIPLVDGMSEVDALVALQPDEARSQDVRHHLRRLGLADSGFALDEQRLLEPQREKNGRGETAVADVAALAKAPLDFVNARRSRHPFKRLPAG